MSLTTCPECSHQVSTLAAACPGCGYPIAGPARVTSNSTVSDVAKTAGAVAGLWVTAPWLARLVFGVVGVVGLFTWLIVGTLNR